MTDFEKCLSAYADDRTTVAKANALNKNIVFDALAAAGVTTVAVTFDGGGDDGQVESIIAHRGAHPVELPSTPVTTHGTEAYRKNVTPRHQSLPDAVEELCYVYLEEMHPGWENTDGAYGEFRFDVTNRTIELEFNARYTDVVTDIDNL